MLDVGNRKLLSIHVKSESELFSWGAGRELYKLCLYKGTANYYDAIL